MKTIRLLIFMVIGIILVIILDQVKQLIRPEVTQIVRDTLWIHLEGEDSIRIARQAKLGMIRPTSDMKILPMKEYHQLLASIGLADTIHIHDTIMVDFRYSVYQSVIDTAAILTLRDSISGDSATASIYAKAIYTLPPVNQHEIILNLRNIEIQHTNSYPITKPNRWYALSNWSMSDLKRGAIIATALIIGLKLMSN